MTPDVDQFQPTPMVLPAIPPYRYFHFERLLFYIALCCMLLCIPLSVIGGIAVVTSMFPLQILDLIFCCLFGIGVLVVASANMFADRHLRRSAISVQAIIMRGYHLSGKTFTATESMTQRATKVTNLAVIPSIEARFVTTSGQIITLALPNAQPDMKQGDKVTLLYLATNPQVATLASYRVYPVTILYGCLGVGLIAAGIWIIR
jgi:hypothetical protein